MKFSIIMPVFNGGRFIGRAIESVLCQTYPVWELIVINDGSTDDTVRTVGEYAASDLRIRLIDMKDNSKRLGFVRNAGTRVSTGDYISFLDADDIFYPEKLKEVKRVLENDPEADLVCHGQNHVMDGRIKASYFYGPYRTHRELLFYGNALAISAVTVRRNCLVKAGGFSERPDFRGVEDYDLWLRLAKSCKFVYLRKLLGELTFHTDNLSSNLREHFDNTFRMMDVHFSNWNKKSLYYKWLLRKRKSDYARFAARALIKSHKSAEAWPFIAEAFRLNPFSIALWAIAILCSFRLIIEGSL